MIYIIKNNIFSSNTYILAEGRDCIVIDPGLDKGIILKALKEYDLVPLAVMSTHGHFDHIAGVADVVGEYGVPFYMHKNDLKLSKSANFYLKLAKINCKIDIITPDLLFEGNHEVVKIKNFKIDVFNFPGHSNGSCVFQFGESLFSGDTIYKTGLGFNNFPGEDKARLRTSIVSIFETFDPDFMIYPGHGAPATLKEIRMNNKDLSLFIEKQN